LPKRTCTDGKRVWRGTKRLGVRYKFTSIHVQRYLSYSISEDLVHINTSNLVFSNKNLSFKNVDFFLHVANYLAHKHAKIHIQILCILCYTKMTTYRSEYVYFNSTNFMRICYFYIAHNTNNIVIKNYILVDYIILNI
jgi:hypothetical protein